MREAGLPVIHGSEWQADDSDLAEAAFIFEHLGTPEKSMVSFIGKDHMMMVSEPEPMKRMKHFAVAFFGYHLQGRDEYSQYFSEDFVAQFEDLAWGMYEK